MHKVCISANCTLSDDSQSIKQQVELHNTKRALQGFYESKIGWIRETMRATCIKLAGQCNKWQFNSFECKSSADRIRTVQEGLTSS